MLCVVQILGLQGLAFRGKNGTLYRKDNRNFLQLTEHIPKFDFLIGEHLRWVSGEEMNVHYLSKTIQNEFINLISSKYRITFLIQ